jgi:pimeloyl-ACP methyl ester carboxylesterase
MEYINGSSGWIQAAQDWRRYPQLSEERISGIQCPALFITGEHDPFVGEEKIKQLSALVPKSSYLVVPGGSHGPHMLRENPTLVNETIFRFLAKYPFMKDHVKDMA